MYEYKTELLKTGVKILNDSANIDDLEALDNFVNDKAQEGWELVTYSYMANVVGVKGAFAVTFRKQK